MITQGNKNICYLKHVQLEIGRLLKQDCKRVYIDDGYSINVVIWADEYALCIPKVKAFEPNGFISPKCDFELRKYGYENEKVNMDEMEFIKDYPKEEIISILVNNLFLSR